MSAIAIPNRSIVLPYSSSAGSSSVSESLQGFFGNELARLRIAVTWDYLASVLCALGTTYQECSEAGWDGYDALPITQETYDESVRFLNAFPSWLPTPEIVPEPSGDIGFEWNFGKNRIIAVSIDGTNCITYAGLLGAGNKAHGTEIFDGSIPQTLVSHISRIC